MQLWRSFKIKSLDGAAIISQNLGIKGDDDMFVTSEVKIYGTSYNPHLYVFKDGVEGDPVFDYIATILVRDPLTVIFVVKSCTTIDFVPHFHSYVVKIDELAVFQTVTPDNLKDHLPLSTLNTYQENIDPAQNNIALRYIIN